MLDVLPAEYYTPLFYNMLLIILLFVFVKLMIRGYVIQNSLKKEITAPILLILVILYIGFRPISHVFADMPGYNYVFEHYASGGEIYKTRDKLWNYFMKMCSHIMTAKIFFLLCAILYVLPIYIACKKWLGQDRYFLFLMFIVSFSFWGAGTNGIRNGIATSFFLLGVSYDKSVYKYLILALTFLIHGSMLIPIAAFVLTLFYKNPKHYLFGWFLAILLSLTLGNYWENLFTTIGIGGSRLQYLTMNNFDDQFSSLGFRWDFLIYSAVAVFVGYYFIIKKMFKDKVYIQLFNIYVTANAFWILVIRASFSNRFAYLSWFLMAVIIFYPFFKAKFFKKQQKILAFSILAYFGFTYMMFLIK